MIYHINMEIPVGLKKPPVKSNFQFFEKHELRPSETCTSYFSDYLQYEFHSPIDVFLKI